MASSEVKETLSGNDLKPNTSYLHKFRLYETRSNFYVIGHNKSKTAWRVLKIDRLEPSKLNVFEDSTTYSEIECSDLLTRLNDGNKSTGGLKFVTACYGIVGFVKFLGPYYILLITQRRKIGAICGQAIYAISKSQMIPIPNSALLSNMAFFKNENRYKKLLCTVDLTKDFFFSYSYHVMHSLQKNMSQSNDEGGKLLYETMFVWNEFMTRGIRNHLKNTLWTVALVYGFFKQVKLSISGKDFNLTLIARRSRHYAGTRYLKRGVNEKGRVANDVETEQIVFEDVLEGCPNQMSSVVQNRGSIPLFWSQETSRMNIKPDIILSKKDPKYEATKLHFKNLEKRYGNPIIILNLIKAREKRPRESTLRAEFCTAIDLINKELPEESRLKFLHWDLNKFSRIKGTNVLALLAKMAAYALNLTGFFYCQVQPTLRAEEMMSWSYFMNNDDDDQGLHNQNSNDLSAEVCNAVGNFSRTHLLKSARQKGVLRTNCIDCLDRTNVAQYAYGLVALGHQLHALGLTDAPDMNLSSPLADDLMRIYEMMGDTLALQYGGSPAHNKIFSQSRGQWKAATQSQEILRLLQRYYSNAYMDAEKQDAINVFLGHFRPHHGKPELWELGSDQHLNVGSWGFNFTQENMRSSFKRSLSDGNVTSESSSPVEKMDVDKNENYDLLNKVQGGTKGLSESTPEILTCETDASFSRCSPAIPNKQLFPNMHPEQFCERNKGLSEHWYSFNCSNFLEADWHSSSGNSCEEETYERSTVVGSPITGISSDNVLNDLKVNTSTGESGLSMQAREPSVTGLEYAASHSSNILAGFSDTFLNWLERCCSLDYRK